MTTQFKERLANSKIGFIGGGNMAYAIAKGFVDYKVVDAITAVSGPHLDKLKENWGGLAKIITTTNWEVILCTKFITFTKKNIKITGHSTM